ncbi:patatin-like phospholipase family protein [Flavobacterium sp.]|uniref:patatin-like phospholipase family protein n=1 Tax=Flavobacterium sp. TaxID=239 RepID=UPI0025B83140|nr:patatin-like phospholipase family protein [Flavobacterium sp.]
MNKKKYFYPIFNAKRQKTFFVWCFLLLTLPLITIGQTTNSVPNPPGPKIGLVLSGGGAKGLAHIGVLKVIDSLGIKIDYIGGTSMGAIIGGLYASGYNAKQLDSIFTTLDADALIQDYVPRGSKSFFEKRNDELYAITLPFKKLKLETPNALSKGMYNYNLLSKLTFHVRHLRDFNRLPIPFFCMATDIETGEEIILNKGILAQAMVASGSIPSLFNPIEIEGRMLVDGGVKNNYPVENLKAMGADIIIGVDVQDGLKKKDELKGVSTILLQISNFGTLEKMPEKIKKTDIYIKPNITGFTVLSFDEGKTIIKNGENAAIKELYRLINLKDDVYQKPNLRVKSDTIAVTNINFNVTKNYTRSYLLGKLKIKPKSKVTYKNLIDGIQNLNSTQNFSAIKYAFENNNLNIDLKENNVNTFLKFGIRYDDFLKSAALINITQKKIISKNDLLSLDIILGDNFRYDLNYLIDNGFYWSFGINSSFITFNRNVSTELSTSLFNNINLKTINLDYSSFNNQAFIQTLFSKRFTIGGGIEWQHLKIKTDNLANDIGKLEDSDYLSFFGSVTHDSFNKKYFPTKGWYLKGNFKTYVFSTDYTNSFDRFSIGKMDIGIVASPIKKWSVLIQAETGFKIGRSTTPFFDFILGGTTVREVNNFRPFYGYNYLTILGNSFIKASTTIDYEFYKKNHFNLSYNAANVGSFIFDATKKWIDKPSFTGFALGYGLDSIVGPIELKYSWSPESKNSYFWVNVGFIF